MTDDSQPERPPRSPAQFHTENGRRTAAEATADARAHLQKALDLIEGLDRWTRAAEKMPEAEALLWAKALDDVAELFAGAVRNFGRTVDVMEGAAGKPAQAILGSTLARAGHELRPAREGQPERGQRWLR